MLGSCSLRSFSGSYTSNLPEASGDRVCNPKFKKGKGNNSPNENPTCVKYGKNHYGEFQRGRIIALFVASVVTI